MREIDVAQGTEAWLEIRKGYHTASDAPAMMGVRPDTTRDELLEQKFTGIAKEVSDFTKKIWADGHRAEKMARPLAEALLGDDLYPIVCADDDLGMLASLDGAIIGNGAIWEHKLGSKKSYESVISGDILPVHYWQLEHQLLVMGNPLLLFMVSDGTEEQCVYMWYKSIPQRRKDLIAGWKQFDEDLANYSPSRKIIVPVGELSPDLPAVIVNITGSVFVTDNFDKFETALKRFVGDVLIKSPENDQDFADLVSQIKILKKAEEALKLAGKDALNQVASISEVLARRDTLLSITRSNRLMAEKLLEAEKSNRRRDIVDNGIKEINDYMDNIEADLGGIKLPNKICGPIYDSIKGKKTMASIHSSVNNAIALEKIKINESAGRIRANIAIIEENSAYKFLFSDLQEIIEKQNDDFERIVNERISKYKSEEGARRSAIEASKESEAACDIVAEAGSSEEKTADISDSIYISQEKMAIEIKEDRNEAPSRDEVIEVIAGFYGVDITLATRWINSVFGE